MSNAITDLPAFPTLGPLAATGITKRELFAAMAMRGVLSDPEGLISIEESAHMAVTCADALLAELAKPKADE